MGSIKKGKLANFAVLDKDLLNDPKDEILKKRTVQGPRSRQRFLTDSTVGST